MAVKTRAQIQAESNTTYIDNTVGSITPASVRSLNDNWTDSTVFVNQTGSMTVGTASLALTASFLLGSIASASFALTASSVNQLNQNVNINGTLTVDTIDGGAGGDLVIQTGTNLFTIVQHLSSSDAILTGAFTGSLNGTASFASNVVSSSFATTSSFSTFSESSLSSSFAISSSLSVSSSFATTSSFAHKAANADLASTASFVTLAQTASFVTTAQTASFVTLAQTASFVQNAQSASFVLNSVSSSFASSASHAEFADNIPSNLNITASNLLVTNNLTVQGTASFGYTETITGSAVIIGEQFIILNANPPAARYAGIQVFDSASFGTASFEWDGTNDNWIVVEETGLTAGILTGPTGSRGSEVFPSANRLIKGSGHHTVNDSNISDNGIVVSINSNSQITGSLIVSAGITANLTGTASFASEALSSSFASQTISSSFANSSISASFASSAISSSFSNNSISSSFANQALNADTASFVLNAVSSSFASNSVSSSFANFANTASFVLGVISSASFATSALTASFVLNAVSSSFASSALTASFVLNAVSSSFSTNSLTASLANTIGILSQSVVITGSVQGNVVSGSIASSTSSLDFNLGNFFTSVVSGSTFFNVTNVKPGQTVNVLLTTVGALPASASFSSNVKQPSGSLYTPTSGSGKTDALTFASWDATNVYLVSVKNLI